MKDVATIAAGVVIGAAVVVIAILYGIVSAVVAVVKAVYKLVVPVKTAADAFHAKLVLEKEQIPNHADLHHEQLDALYEVVSRLFDDWNALMKQAEVVDAKVLRTGTTLLAGATCPGADIAQKVLAMCKFIAFALQQGQVFSDSFRELAHRSEKTIVDVSRELDNISSARAAVLQRRRLNIQQYDFVVDTNREIHKLQLEIESFLGTVKPHLQRMSARSVRDQVRDQLAVAHPDADAGEVELLLTAH
jgi:uncharacterized membrane protein YhiD involved in acid resistance